MPAGRLEDDMRRTFTELIFLIYGQNNRKDDVTSSVGRRQERKVTFINGF